VKTTRLAILDAFFRRYLRKVYCYADVCTAIFANANSVTQLKSNKFEKINPTLGTGFRIKLKKNSDANLTIDFAKSTGGSDGFAFGVNEMF
jgi:hypothetical protein